MWNIKGYVIMTEFTSAFFPYLNGDFQNLVLQLYYYLRKDEGPMIIYSLLVKLWNIAVSFGFIRSKYTNSIKFLIYCSTLSHQPLNILLIIYNKFHSTLLYMIETNGYGGVKVSFIMDIFHPQKITIVVINTASVQNSIFY